MGWLPEHRRLSAVRHQHVETRGVKRAIILSLVLGLVVGLGAGLWLGGRYWVTQLRMESYDRPPTWGIAQAHPEFGHGTVVPLRDARLISGAIQVLVGVESCTAISGFDIDEQPDRVVLEAREVALPGMCAGVGWDPLFVVLRLERPLGSRRLLDTDGTPIAIQDCDHPVKPHWKLCGVFTTY